MPTLISDTEKNNLTGIFNDIFDTFKREIVVGVFDATIRYNLDQDQQRLGDIPQDVEVGEVFIKVKENARNYINKGKTEKITFDNKSFKVTSLDANRSFLNSKFFVYKLESTK